MSHAMKIEPGSNLLEGWHNVLYLKFCMPPYKPMKPTLGYLCIELHIETNLQGTSSYLSNAKNSIHSRKLHKVSAIPSRRDESSQVKGAQGIPESSTNHRVLRRSSFVPCSMPRNSYTELHFFRPFPFFFGSGKLTLPSSTSSPCSCNSFTFA